MIDRRLGEKVRISIIDYKCYILILKNEKRGNIRTVFLTMYAYNWPIIILRKVPNVAKFYKGNNHMTLYNFTCGGY